MLKRMLSFLLSIAMILSMLPVQALAAEGSTEEPTAPTETAAETTAAETTIPAETTDPTTGPTVETTEETTLPEETEAPNEETSAPIEENLPVPVKATREITESSGTIGEVEWFYGGGTLIVAGGAIPDFERYGAPWYIHAYTITNIVIEEGVTAIGDYAFADLMGVSNLTWLAISDSTNGGSGNIGNGLSWTLDSAGTLVISGSGAVAEYANHVFDDIKTDVTTLILKEGVTGIGAYAFQYFTNLAKLTLPSTVKNIDADAFYNCTALSLVIMPNHIETLGDQCFGGCKKLAAIVFRGDAPTQIHYRAFQNVTATVWYPEDNDTWAGVPANYGGYLTWLCGSPYGEEYYIAQGSFDGGMGWRLTDTGVLTISGFGEMANTYYPWSLYQNSITEVVIQRDITSISYEAFYDMKYLKKVTLPETVTSIDAWAFQRCTALEEINLPASLTKIDSGAFAECTSLKSVVVPGTVAELYRVFSDCTSLQNVTLGEGITSIEGAFEYCTSLTSITLPDSLVTLGSEAFRSCSSLTTVHFGSNLKTIEARAFYLCTSLQNVDLPDSVTTIENSAFCGCESFTAVHIPRGVTSILNNAFADCRYLKSVIFEGDAPTTWAVNTFNSSVTATIYYPAGNETWTSLQKENFTGNLTWVAYDTVDSEIIGVAVKTSVTEVTLVPGESTKIADIVRDENGQPVLDENGNVQLKLYKTGSITITVTASDGSKQKVSFKLNVVKKVETLTLEDQEVSGGKSLNLASFLTIDPGDATNKKLTWKITGDEAYATISASGVLKAKKVTAAKKVEVTVTAQDGSGVSDTCIVTIKP